MPAYRKHAVFVRRLSARPAVLLRIDESKTVEQCLLPGEATIDVAGRPPFWHSSAERDNVNVDPGCCSSERFMLFLDAAAKERLLASFPPLQMVPADSEAYRRFVHA